MVQRVAKEKIRHLVFKGGSVKGIAYIGCLFAMMALGIDLTLVESVAGTSAGSIMALMVALKLYENEEELKGFMYRDFTEFLDAESPDISQRLTSIAKSNKLQGTSTGSRLLSDYLAKSGKFGLAKGEIFREWLEREVIEEVTGRVNCTFREFGELGFKDLRVVAFTLTTKAVVIFSKKTTPDAIISDAIRSSISIPFVFEPHRMYVKNEHDEREVLEEMKDHQLIDGGISMNFPMPILADCPQDEILGLYLATPKEKSQMEKCSKKMEIEDGETNQLLKSIYEKNQERPENEAESSPVRNYLYAIASVYWKYKNQLKDHEGCEKNFKRTIYIDDLNVSSLAFNLDNEQKDDLQESGANAVKEFFAEEYQNSDTNSESEPDAASNSGDSNPNADLNVENADVQPSERSWCNVSIARGQIGWY